MTQIQKLRAWVRQHPRLKALLLPIYMIMMRLQYQARNLLTCRRPIVFEAGHKCLKLYPEGSIAEVLYSGNFEPTERDFVVEFLKPGMTFVDAGVNIGFYTVIASGIVGKAGRDAFEPGRSTFERLVQNLALNNCQNVVPKRVALSNSHEQMLLRAAPQHPALDSHRFVCPIDAEHNVSTDEIVETQTLDDYFFGGKTIDFMKIDVEGAEFGLLLGAQKTLQRSSNITILLECTENRQQVKDLLAQHGFECFVWKDKVLKPVLFDAVITHSNVVLHRQRGIGK